MSEHDTPTTHTEQWRPIAGFEGYEISSHGRVRRAGKIKKLSEDRKGYAKVTLWIKQRKFTKIVAPLVAEAFIGPRPPGQVVCHKDGDNRSNHHDNLRWGTRASNEADKLAHGTARHRENHPSAKLTAEQVAAIRKRYVFGSKEHSLEAIGRDYGVTGKNIHHIIQGKLWKP